MLINKEYKNIVKYIGVHIIYAIIGILMYVPCVYHLTNSERSLSNLSNSEYINHLCMYLKHLAYAFTIKDNVTLVSVIILAVFGGVIYSIRKKRETFITLLTIVPTIIYFLLVVQLTSFRELRYIMPIMPFVVLTVMIILDNILEIKYKDICLILISVLLVISGFIFSKPKFLFEEYKDSLEIAEANSDKPFVYVYDNIFNHIQSVPEMMIYEKSIVINYNKGELQYIINSNELNKEDSYILCIKTYMDNNKIIEEIKQNTNFKNVTQIYFGPEASSEVISNNLYLVTK